MPEPEVDFYECPECENIIPVEAEQTEIVCTKCKTKIKDISKLKKINTK